MALVGIELETFVSESDALTTRPPTKDRCRIVSQHQLRKKAFFIQYMGK